MASETAPILARPQTRQTLAVVSVILLAGALRFYQLDASPPGINQDEAVHAYDAWCIRETGRDHYGEPWPIFFRCFSDYHAGHYIYGLIPFQAVFGVSVWSTRLPAALFGTLSVLFLYSLVRRLCNHRTGLLAAILLAVSPWHICTSRLAYEATWCAPILTLAMLLVASSVSRIRDPVPRPGTTIGDDPATGSTALSNLDLFRLGCAGLISGLGLWNYNALRVVVPALLIVGLIVYARSLRTFIHRPRAKLAVGVFFVMFILGVVPFIWASIATPEQAWARASMVIGGGDTGPIGATIQRCLKVYLAHFSPAFLFLEGDPSPIQSVPGWGQLHLYCAILLPVGLWRVIRERRTNRFGLFVVAWILIGPMPAALTPLETGHALRSIGVLPAFQILAALGLDRLLNIAERRSTSARRAAIALASLAIAASAGLFAHRFFTTYPNQAAIAFQQEWQPAVTYARQVQDDYDAIVLTTRRTNQVGMLALFWAKIPPETYFAEPHEIEQGPRWDVIRRVGKFFFLPAERLPEFAAHFPPGARFLVAERPEVPIPGDALGEICYPNGAVALVVYAVQTRAANP